VTGTVLSWRPRSAFGLVEDVAKVVPVTGLGGPHPTRVALAETEADVIVADWQSWGIAQADGRPFVRIGFAHRSETLWDLDERPLHPSGRKPPEPLRSDLRAALGLSGPVVVSMSPLSQRGIIEGTIEAAARTLDRHPEATLVVAPPENGGVLFRAADLVVTSAGWSSSWEARWSGVPHFLVRTNDSDQWLRYSGGVEDLAKAVEAVVEVEDWKLPEIPDHVPEFVERLRSASTR
jgi:hypothetical protein